MMSWFIYEIKSRFVFYKNSDLDVYYKARFSDMMLWRVSLICLQNGVEELLWGV
jgi:hypothetical protein